MKTRTIAILSLVVVSMFLLCPLMPICNISAEETGNNDEVYVCELTVGETTKQYTSVTAAVNYWNDNGSGDCLLSIYETTTAICEDPINIVQKKIDGVNIDRSLKIVAQGNVVMKCKSNATSVFTITASSDFTQTPSLTFKNIVFDLREAGKACYGIYSSGSGSERYIRGIFVESCSFIGTKSYNCVGVGTTANGSADFVLYQCLGKDLHTLFNGYCFVREHSYGLYIEGCTLTNGKYFVNNQSGEHTTYIKDCVADYHGSSDDSYGVRTGGSSLYMDNVRLTYTGSYGTAFDAFVVVKADGNIKVQELSLNNCVFQGYDDVTNNAQGDHKNDIYIQSGGVVKFVVDGVETPTFAEYYNFPRYTVSIDNGTGGLAKISDGHYEKESLKVMKGAELTLSFVADNKYVFTEWSTTSELGIDAKNQFLMVGENVTITPVFNYVGVTTYNVTVTSNVGGSVSPSKSVESGSDYYFVAKADDNYALSDVKINGQSVGAPALYTVNITQATTIEVTFALSPRTTTEIVGDYEYVVETTTSEYSFGEESVSKVTDSDSEVTYQARTEGKILDVVTTATHSETQTELDSVESKITMSSTVTEKTAKVVATSEYMEVANQQIASIVSKVGIEDESPVYLMNIHSDTTYEKINAEFGKGIVTEIDGKNGLIAISSEDEAMKGCSSVVLDRDIVNGISGEEFMTMSLFVGVTEELTEEQKAVVGDNTVVYAKMMLIKESGPPVEVKELGGTATVSIYHEFETEYPDFEVYYVSQEGEMQKMSDATYDPETKLITFTTTHFSEFVIMEDNSEPKETASGFPVLLIAILAVVAIIALSFLLFVYGIVSARKE